MALSIPLYPDSKVNASALVMPATISGWNSKAKSPPNNVPIRSAAKGGVFLIIKKITIKGTKNNHPLILR